ncbi:tyrosine-protein phosphatase [Acetobacterium tundrae]|nr:tyrosine-protein phosphatase [Acetobacterium tundrae]
MEKDRKVILLGLCVTALVCIFAMAGCGVNTSEKGAGNAQIKNTVTQESQTIGLTGVDNARQLGEYVTTDGKKIKDGILLRTGKLSGATNEDITTLTGKYHLTEIIDLRSTAEIEAALDPVIDGVTEENVRIADETSPAYLTAMSVVRTDDPVGDAITEVENGTISDTLYSYIVTSTYGQQAYHEFFEKLLAHENGAILFHCSAGKDRTGLAAVLLLSALGVDRETIMEDFALTNDFYADNIDYMVSETKKRTDDAKIIEGVYAVVGANSSYMEKMFDAINEKYGSMDNFLKEAIGLTDKDVTKLRDMYLE